MKIAIENLVPNPEQPRQYFDEVKLQELGEDLKIHQLRSLWVLPASNELPFLYEHCYLIIDGERRWKAASKAGIPELECEVLNLPYKDCLLYTSPSPRDGLLSRMPSSA